MPETTQILQILKYIVCGLIVLDGVMAVFAPQRTAVFTGLTPKGGRGITEIRSLFGGFFIALGLTPFFLGDTAYAVMGIGYLANAVVRLISIFIDKSSEASNWFSLAFNIAFGVILIL
jgi:hypothetical protein